MHVLLPHLISSFDFHSLQTSPTVPEVEERTPSNLVLRLRLVLKDPISDEVSHVCMYVMEYLMCVSNVYIVCIASHFRNEKMELNDIKFEFTQGSGMYENSVAYSLQLKRSVLLNSSIPFKNPVGMLPLQSNETRLQMS